ELLGAIAVALFDAALGVEPVAAHVPFADGAGRTWHRIGTAHDADHEIAARKAAALRRFFDAAERLVAEDQMPGPGRWRAVFAGDDLAVGAADAERERAHQDIAVAGRRRRNVCKLDRVGDSRFDGQRAHADLFVSDRRPAGTMRRSACRFHRHQRVAALQCYNAGALT